MAHRQHLRYVLGSGCQPGNRIEWAPEIVEVKARHNDLFAGHRQGFAHRHETLVKKLAFIDADDDGLFVHRPQQRSR